MIDDWLSALLVLWAYVAGRTHGFWVPRVTRLIDRIGGDKP